MKELLVTESDVVRAAFKKMEGKSKQERRKIEMTHLQPDKLPATKAGGMFDQLQHLSVKLLFKDEHNFILFKKHFPVSRTTDQHVNDLRPIVALVRELEEGTLKYDKKKDKLIRADRDKA